MQVDSSIEQAQGTKFVAMLSYMYLMCPILHGLQILLLSSVYVSSTISMIVAMHGHYACMGLSQTTTPVAGSC
jgi:hypothetical protein